jgi:hypothetical protein
VVVQSGRADHVVWHNERPRAGIGASHAWLHSRSRSRPLINIVVARVLLQWPPSPGKRNMCLLAAGTGSRMQRQDIIMPPCDVCEPTNGRPPGGCVGLFALTCCSFNLAITAITYTVFCLYKFKLQQYK